ncbi:MAG: pilus assembly protein [Alphaproteobacteria bacterium]|nr:pilus assembly protein [Alphaproteobacteria bacterium]
MRTTIDRLLRASRPRRARRGAEFVEFAIIFPIYLILFFGIMEYSWYFYQRSVAIEAARVGCRVATQLDPDVDGATAIQDAATDAALEVLANDGGFDCGDEGVHSCAVAIDTTNMIPGSTPRRLICGLSVNYVSLTGYLGSSDDVGGPAGEIASDRWGASGGIRLIPEFIQANATSIFEEDD